jgi:iron complex transport system substrate-binding protein
VRTLVALLLFGAVLASGAWTAAVPPWLVATRAGVASVVSPGPYPKTATDPLGHRTILRSQPRRIVSLTLGSDEILLDLVPSERLAGLSIFVDSPSASLASAFAPKGPARVTGEPESLLALEPDLIVASAYTRPDALSLLEGAGAPMIGIGSHTTFDGILATVTMLGAAVGEPERAQSLVVAARSRIDAVAARGRERGRARRVLVWDGGFTYGRGTLEDEMVRLAGGENVARGLQGAAGLTEEAVVAFDPEVIIVPVQGAAVEHDALRLVGNSPIWRATDAVRRGDVHGVPRAWIGSVSHHAVRALEAISAILDQGGA